MLTAHYVGTSSLEMNNISSFNAIYSLSDTQLILFWTRLQVPKCDGLLMFALRTHNQRDSNSCHNTFVIIGGKKEVLVAVI